MVRVGSLKDMELYDPKKIDQRTGMNSQEQLSAIYEQTRELYAMRDTIYKELNKTMLDLQMSNVSWKSLSKKQKNILPDTLKTRSCRFYPRRSWIFIIHFHI